MADPSGVVFPTSGADGDRSTSALGRAVVADALRGVDPVGARAAESRDRLAAAVPRALPAARRGGPRLRRRRPADRRRRAGLPARPDARRPRRTARRSGCATRSPGRPPRRSAPSRCAAPPSPSASSRCRTAASGCAATPCTRRLDDWVAARRRRAVLRARPCARSPPPPSGSTPPTCRSSCSARAPRWGRCSRCCAGAARSSRSTCPGPRCGSACSRSPAAPRAR